jgi:APA family basic amino acid/polyamine antiporter
MTSPPSVSPVRHLSAVDAIGIIVGIVVGSMIFKAPAWVAGLTGSASWMMLTWLLGGFLCLCGALCYAELATTYPHVGGEYTYLSRAFGRHLGFLFIWARSTVIQTGSIAMLAYVFGDYLANLLGARHVATPMLFALAATAVLTGFNLVGLRVGARAQNVLTAVKVIGVLGIVAVGLLLVRPAASADTTAAASAPAAPVAGWPGFSALGLAMVFVLYTFGGWNEAAYVAGEVRHRRRDMLWVLLGGVGLITLLYVAANLAYLRALGMDGMAGAKQAVAAELMQRGLGAPGVIAVTVLVAVAALSAIDGCIFTGSRAMAALGQDHAAFRFLGQWHPRFRTPVAAIGVQSVIAAILILLPGLGGPRVREWLGSGFDTAVEYTAPAFWLFLLLTGVSVVVLRFRDRRLERPFRVPLFFVTVFLFCLMSGWMLYRSLDYRLGGAVVGVAVLAAGVPVLLASRRLARSR